MAQPRDEKKSLDLAWNSFAVENISDTTAVVQTMADVVRPSGFVFIDVPYLFESFSCYHLTPLRAAQRWL
jgi:hypothetical protein